ncbi:MAG TPA: efflux transporter outer membrane subunit [Steroidobacteraceae bacterium]|jgi:NodT family efflux transporter outer membrane factor (OMF) lipoprotein|nr:efflux transporter outer membrane subunit [Steroidobacteraceae bacterium]
MNRRCAAAAIGALLAALVAACRVGPNYHAPAMPKDAEAPLVAVNAAAETVATPPDAWWHLYNDPRLDTLIKEALGANRNLAAANANLTAARAVLTAAHANRYPSTSAVAGGIYGRDAVTDEILELEGQPPQTFWLFEDVFQAAYEVDLFGRVHRAIEVANANADAVADARDSIRVVVAAETARAYAAVCALGEELSVARRSLEVVSGEADITVHGHDAGASSEYDVARAQTLVAQVRSSIPPIEGQRRAAIFELAALLGRAPADAPNELESCTLPPRLVALIPVGDGSALLKRRPDVREAERRLAAATAEIGVTTADLYPTIRLVGLYGGEAVALSQLNNNIGRTWGVGPSISWAFPNMAGPRARVRQAKAAQAAALASFDAVVLAALKETEQALVLYSAALDNRQSLGEAQDRIHAAFGMAHDQFLAGSVSYLDLLTTEQTLVSVDAAVASSDASLVQDQIAVFKALGGGWHGNEGHAAP